MPDVIYGYIKSHTNFSGIELPEVGMKASTFLKPLFRIGTSGSPVHIKTDTIPLFEIQATCALTSGTSRTMYLTQTQTGTKNAGYERVLDVVWNGENGKGGGDCAVIRAQAAIGTGGVHGIMNALTTELYLPDGSVGRGTLYALEIRVKGQTSSSWASSGPVGFIRVRAAGTVTNIDDNAQFMVIRGFNAGADHLLSLESQTLRCSLSETDCSGANLRYLVLSQMQDGLGLGASDNLMALGTSTTKRAIQVYTTSAATDAGTSIKYIYGYHEVTGGGGVGHRAEFHTKCTGATGSWLSALKAMLEYNDTGYTTGTSAAIVAETILASRVGGHAGYHACLECELGCESDTDFGTVTAFINMVVYDNGSDGTGAFDDSGYVFNISGLSEGDDHVWDMNGTPAAKGTLRFSMEGTPYYFLITDTPA
jgi:hypothetical protein